MVFKDVNYSGASNAYTTNVRTPTMPYTIRSSIQFLKNRPARSKVETLVNTLIHRRNMAIS